MLKRPNDGNDEINLPINEKMDISESENDNISSNELDNNDIVLHQSYPQTNNDNIHGINMDGFINGISEDGFMNNISEDGLINRPYEQPSHTYPSRNYP